MKGNTTKKPELNLKADSIATTYGEREPRSADNMLISLVLLRLLRSPVTSSRAKDTSDGVYRSSEAKLPEKEDGDKSCKALEMSRLEDGGVLGITSTMIEGISAVQHRAISA